MRTDADDPARVRDPARGTVQPPTGPAMARRYRFQADRGVLPAEYGESREGQGRREVGGPPPRI